jgi:hypothetical protein
VTDLNRAWNICAKLPTSYETSGDAKRVQWAARRAVEALERLDLEINIANERNAAGRSARSTKLARDNVKRLSAMRGKR